MIENLRTADIEKQRAMIAKSDNLENLERRRPRLRKFVEGRLACEPEAAAEYKD